MDMMTAQRARQSYATVDSSTRTEQASPHRLIELLYDELLSCLRQAGIAITNGDLEMKSGRLSKALSIVHGLESGLDFTRGGEVARPLGDVYASVRRQVIAAGSDKFGRAPCRERVGPDVWISGVGGTLKKKQ